MRQVDVFTLDQLDHLRDADVVEEQVAVALVDGRAAPVEATVVARVDQGVAGARCGELTLVVELAEVDAAHQLVEEGRAPHVLFGQRFGAQRRHAYRVGLGLGYPVAFGMGLGHGFFDHVGNRLAGATVEQEDLPALGQLDQRGDLAALAVRHVVQRRLGSHVVVPDVVVHGLEGPALAAGGHVQGNHGRRVFLGQRRAIATPEIGLLVAGRQVDQAQFVIERRGGPHVRRAAGIGFALRWQLGDGRVAQVPRPHQFAGVGAEGTHHA